MDQCLNPGFIELQMMQQIQKNDVVLTRIAAKWLGFSSEFKNVVLRRQKVAFKRLFLGSRRLN